MNSALAIHRLHFAFMMTFHYLFPQMTMCLGLLIVVLKAIALFKNPEWLSRSGIPFWCIAVLPAKWHSVRFEENWIFEALRVDDMSSRGERAARFPEDEKHV